MSLKIKIVPTYEGAYIAKEYEPLSIVDFNGEQFINNSAALAAENPSNSSKWVKHVAGKSYSSLTEAEKNDLAARVAALFPPSTGEGGSSYITFKA